MTDDYVLRPLRELVIVTQDLIVAGELDHEWSTAKPNAPEDYRAIWERQAEKALRLVRFIRYGTDDR